MANCNPFIESVDGGGERYWNGGCSPQFDITTAQSTSRSLKPPQTGSLVYHSQLTSSELQTRHVIVITLSNH